MTAPTSDLMMELLQVARGIIELRLVSEGYEGDADILFDILDTAEKEVAALRAERDRLRVALESVEWCCDSEMDDSRACPVCGYSERDGHVATCWLRAALAGKGEG